MASTSSLSQDLPCPFKYCCPPSIRSTPGKVLGASQAVENIANHTAGTGISSQRTRTAEFPAPRAVSCHHCHQHTHHQNPFTGNKKLFKRVSFVSSLSKRLQCYSQGVWSGLSMENTYGRVKKGRKCSLPPLPDLRLRAVSIGPTERPNHNPQPSRTDEPAQTRLCPSPPSGSRPPSSTGRMRASARKPQGSWGPFNGSVEEASYGVLEVLQGGCGLLPGALRVPAPAADLLVSGRRAAGTRGCATRSARAARG